MFARGAGGWPSTKSTFALRKSCKWPLNNLISPTFPHDTLSQVRSWYDRSTTNGLRHIIQPFVLSVPKDEQRIATESSLLFLADRETGNSQLTGQSPEFA